MIKLPPSIRLLTQRYIDMLEGAGITALEDPEMPCSQHHLLWMLYQLLTNPDQSETKKHRWLGFIQCGMCVHGLTTVQAEREFSRDILNGE